MGCRAAIWELLTSAKGFDGAQYRFEVPIQGPGTMKTLLEELDRYEVSIHRVTQTKGIMSLTDKEIETMVEYAHKWRVELILAIVPGPLRLNAYIILRRLQDVLSSRAVAFNA